MTYSNKEMAEITLANTRNLRQTAILEDIRDLLYINNLNQAAMLELMIEERKTPFDRRYAVDAQLEGMKRIGASMEKRDKSVKKQIYNLMAQYNKFIHSAD